MNENKIGDIVQTGHEALDTISQNVPIEDIGKPEIQSLIKKMHTVVNNTDDGVALAAPQIGINLRIFVIAERAFEDPVGEHLVYINPVITKTSRKKLWVEEGCLSVRWKYGHTHRHQKATVTAYDENGERFERQGSGLLAQIFQHEIDHLDGILFTDHAKDIHDYDPQEHASSV